MGFGPEMTKGYSYIRMSTDRQLKGDSLRRQVEKSERFARENGIELDENFNMRDIGLSAYDGSHIEKGQLGKFLIAVRNGQIPTGSYLIIESLDRLSRQELRSSIRTFLDLLDHGICIATLTDNKVYTSDSDHNDLVASVGVMARAYDESSIKAERISAAWNNKRNRIQDEILTVRTKGWLKPLHDKSGFEIIPERGDIVRRIFDDASNHGLGADRIARQLNEAKVPTFGRSNGWQKSYVQKILNDRAVLGEFLPHTKSAGKRTPLEPIPGYFPAVIDEDTFYRAQSARFGRRVGSSGRKGPGISNIFSGLAKCGVCRGPIHFANKGERGGGQILFCSNAHRGLGCPIRTTWAYDEFETSFLTFIKEADLGTTIGSLGKERQGTTLEARLQASKGRLLEARNNRDKVFNLLLGNEPTDYLSNKLRELDSTVAALEHERMSNARALEEYLQQETAYNESKVGIAELIAKVQSTDGETVRIRSTVASRLKDLIRELIVWPAGHERKREDLEALYAMYPEHSRAELETYMPRPSKAFRSFFVRFKDGTFRFVAPDINDPTRYRSQGATGEYIISRPEVEDYLFARYGLREPTREEIEMAGAQLSKEPELAEKYGASLVRGWKDRK